MKNRFMDNNEAEKNEQKMWDLRYQNDIQDYITKMIDLNCIVGMKGTAWRTTLKIRLPNNILDRLSRWRQLITDDEDLFYICNALELTMRLT
jgi:hypothetical protein